MQCAWCGAEVADETAACPACRAVAVNPAAKRVRIGFGILMAVVFVLVAVVGVLMPARPSPPGPGSIVTTASVDATATAADPERAAVENAIRGFYATVDAGLPATSSAFVYKQGSGGDVRTAVVASGTTTFNVARAVIGTVTADVYGTESRSRVATPGAEVEFRMRRVDGSWLVSSWQEALETTLPPTALSLTDVTASDIVRTVLQAHQVGDSITLGLLTTEAFHLRHESWYDGADRSYLLTSWRIISAQPQGRVFLVRVQEIWLPTPLITTYTVVMVDGEIRVDAWTWK